MAAKYCSSLFSSTLLQAGRFLLYKVRITAQLRRVIHTIVYSGVK